MNKFISWVKCQDEVFTGIIAIGESDHGIKFWVREPSTESFMNEVGDEVLVKLARQAVEDIEQEWID
jgi:hypothetical protein